MSYLVKTCVVVALACASIGVKAQGTLSTQKQPVCQGLACNDKATTFSVHTSSGGLPPDSASAVLKLLNSKDPRSISGRSAEVKALAKQLRGDPNQKITISATGSRASVLAKNREVALKLRDALVQNGVQSKQVEVSAN